MGRLELLVLLVMLLLEVLVPLMWLAVDVRPTNSVTDGVELPETLLPGVVPLRSPLSLDTFVIAPIEMVIVDEYEIYVAPVDTTSPLVIGTVFIPLKTIIESKDDCARTWTTIKQLSLRISGSIAATGKVVGGE